MEYKYCKTLTVLAKKLKKIREEKGLSYSELSRKAGIRANYLKKIENDDAPNMDLLKLIALARGLNVSIEDLLPKD